MTHVSSHVCRMTKAIQVVVLCCLGIEANPTNDGSSENDGNISCQPRAREEQLETGMYWRNRCTIKRIQWPRGQENLPLPDEPYVVEVPRQWNRLMRHNLEYDVLLSSMGNVSCTPSQAGSKRIGIFEMSLAEYLQEWLPKPISKNAEDNRYVFGEFGENWAPLRDMYKLPPCQVCTAAAAAITIGLGGLFSGAPWHFHNAAFVEAGALKQLIPRQ